MARKFTAAQWAGTKPLPRGCRFLADGSISCCSGSVCHSYYRDTPTVVTTQPTATMPSLLSGVSTALVNGRATTTAPTADAPSGGFLTTVGTILGNAVGLPTLGTTLGTVGDAVLTGQSSTQTATTTPGRAVTSLAAPTSVDVFARQPGAVGTAVDRLLGRGGKRPNTAKVKRLVRLIGVSNAADLLGVSDADVAMIAIRPARRRGISAASLRITRRTIRAINSINHSLSCIKHTTTRRRKPC